MVIWLVAIADFLLMSFISSQIMPLAAGLIFSLLTLLGIFSFRSLEGQYLKSLRQQLLRNFAGSIEAIIILALFGKFSMQLLLLSLIFTVLLSVLNAFLFQLLLTLIPAKTYMVDPDDFKSLGHILKEIEEKTFGKVRFKPANPHLLEYAPDEIVITDQSQTSAVPQAPTIAQLCEKHLKRIPLEVIERFKDYYLKVFENVKAESALKRILDIVISLVGLALFSPIMVIISIAILIEDGLPVVFKQERVGKGGKIFVMYKFRSMKDNGKGNTGKFATDEEHRILKIGKFIRKFRLDEILQFINVLKGDMSVVGPRPEQRELADGFEKKIPVYKYRHLVKPGITGWAQLMYKYASGIEETKKKLSYDLWYVKNGSSLTSLVVSLKTLEAILFRRGAV